MAVNSSFVENILEQFVGVEGISTRRMFGGVGIYRYGVMFAIIVDERLYFKVDEVNKPDYQSAGSVPFIYDRHDKHGGKKLITMSYWEVPPHVQEDKDLIFYWMTKAHEAAVKSKNKKVA
jgi:DNA transformation protein